MARAGSMQEVDLVDGAADDEPDPAPGRSRWRWWAVGAAAVAVLALGGTQWVIDQRDAAAVARLARVPGVVPPLGDSLRVVRSLSQDEATSLWSGIDTGEASASLVVAADGSQTFTAVDERTGKTVWSTPLLGPDAERAKPASSVYGGTCLAGAPAPQPSTFAACLVTDGFLRITEGGTQTLVEPTTTRVVVLDTRDGHVLVEWPADDGARLAVLSDLLVVGHRDAERGVEVVAHDPTTGEERWRYAEPLVDDPTATADAFTYRSWTFFAARDVLAFSNGGALTLVSGAGAVVRAGLRVGGSDGSIGVDPVTGELALASYAGGGVVEKTTLLSADGDPAGDRVLDGRLLQTSVDDGSVPGLVLTALGRLHAWDRETGRARWSADVSPGYDAIVVRGRVYLSTSSSLVALDGRTGRTVWETSAALGRGGSLATDGRHVLVPSTPSSGVADGGLVAYDLGTGAEVDRIAYPPGVTDVQMFQGLLLGWSEATDELSVLE
ncbi:outer membrane protein assembly factor BamB family protein [Cellulomonas sp. P5_E12]